jgi:hypothetical protein
VRELLERDQQVVTLLRAGAGDRTEHREEERVDVRLVGGGVLEDQERQCAGLHLAQVGGVLVDLVVELVGGSLDAQPGFLVDQRAAAQRARYRGLGDPGQVRYVDGCGLSLHARTNAEPAPRRRNASGSKS